MFKMSITTFASIFLCFQIQATQIKCVEQNKNDLSSNCYINESGVIDRIPADVNPILHRTHSFFGQMFYYPTDSTKLVVHPESPNPAPGSN